MTDTHWKVVAAVGAVGSLLATGFAIANRRALHVNEREHRVFSADIGNLRSETAQLRDSLTTHLNAAETTFKKLLGSG